MIPQSSFTLSAPIRKGQVEVLRQLLAGMNNATGLADPNNTLLPFGQFEVLHMARFVIIESRTAEDVREYDAEPRPWPPTLVFLGDCDGRVAPFLEKLVSKAEDGLTQVFGHCEDFTPGRDDLLTWMRRHEVRAAANYVNYMGRTVTQAHEEMALHRALREKLLELHEEGEHNPMEVRKRLQAFVSSQREQGQLRLSPIPPTPVGWFVMNLLHKLLVPLTLLLLAPLFVLALPFYLFALRRLENSDPEIVPRPATERVRSLSAVEDQLVTNQFSAFGEVKPGRLRRYTIVFLLYMLNYSARHIYSRGYLTRVQTIHFARWILLDDKHRLLFASNYDGSLESYMDDFINKVAWGLNLVFSNGIGYPGTRWLIKGGAEYEQKFKYYLRRHQLYTDVWYKAYPDATAVELTRNTRIRRGLERKNFRDDHEIRAWLSLI